MVLFIESTILVVLALMSLLTTLNFFTFQLQKCRYCGAVAEKVFEMITVKDGIIPENDIDIEITGLELTVC